MDGESLSPRHSLNAASLALCREALSDSAQYVLHIAQTLSLCAQALRVGADQEAMDHLARGSADLAEFVKLIEHLAALLRPTQDTETRMFTLNLRDCVAALERALQAQDMVGLSDQIEGVLLPLLPSWGHAADELAEYVA